MQCTQCKSQFDYASGEQEAYAGFDAELPTICPQCRHKRHLIFRNERRLFYNKSHKSGKKIISTYPESSPFKIIDKDEWWDDSFDATAYGRDFDFNRPFFEQFKDLQKEVPRWARMYINCENSEFTNNSAEIKDSYLTFSSYDSENLYYCMRVIGSTSCIDCLNVRKSEFCSQCVECKKCYNLHYSQLSESCNDSYFLYDCKNCNDCIMSVQLRNKQYMILNQQYSKEEYKEKKEMFLKALAENREGIVKQFQDFKEKFTHKNLRIINCENCSGDFINDSKNIQNSFYVSGSEDSINLYDCHNDKNCYDNMANEESELCLECDTAYDLYNAKFCSYTVTGSNLTYCDQCVNVKNCFGCVGLHRAEYAILNKKYSKEEYEALLPKIIEHMKQTGEYGKPFPSTLSSFPYNITVAQEYYPLTKEEALASGYMWHDEEEKKDKAYRIIPQEMKFYEKFRLPPPKVSPDERYRELLALQPPKMLVDEKCSNCNKDIKSVYPKDSNYRIVCEDCYLSKVY